MILILRRSRWLIVSLMFLSVSSSLFAQLENLAPRENLAPLENVAQQLGIQRFGYQGFQLLLQQEGIKQVTADYDKAFTKPGDTVFIILGDTSNLTGIGHRLDLFVQRGGGLLLATDVGDRHIGNHFGVFPRAYSPDYDARQRDAFRGLEDCPLITQFRNSHPLFAGIEQLATNRPGVLGTVPTISNQKSIQQVAWLKSRRRRSYKFVVAHESKGKMVAIGDHSLFVNEMLFQEDNMKFAKNCIDWLFEGRRRKQVILICDGGVLPEFSFGNAVPPLPLDDLLEQLQNAPLIAPKLSDSSLRKMVNTLLTSMEDKDVFNQPLRTRPMTAARARGFALIAATIFVTLVFLIWTLKSPWRFQPKMFKGRVPSVHDRLLGGADDNSRGLYLAIRNLFSVGDDQLLNWQHSSFPTVHAKMSPIKSFFVKRKLRRLWKFAHEGGPDKLTKRFLRKTMKQIRQLSGLRDAGILRLE